LGVINFRVWGGRNPQRAAKGNVFTAEIKVVGVTRIGQLELRALIARRRGVFDDADGDQRQVV
jgi:hypothetical protein